jgi:hypothetical protein
MFLSWPSVMAPWASGLHWRKSIPKAGNSGAGCTKRLGKVSEGGEAIGDLTKLELPAARVGEPSLAVGEEHILVAVDGGPDTNLGQVFVGVAERPALPTSAKRVTGIEAVAVAPSITALPKGGFFLQWTEGPVGSQRVHGRVFDANLDARGETFVLSPPGSDAHHGVSTQVGDRVLTVYFVRLPTNNHELWATALSCATTEE